MGLAIATGALDVLLPMRLTMGATPRVLLGAIHRIVRVAFSPPCIVRVPLPCLFQHALCPSKCFARSHSRRPTTCAAAHAEPGVGVRSSRRREEWLVSRGAPLVAGCRRQWRSALGPEPDQR